MAYVSYNPEAANRPFLPQAGLYGVNQEHEAVVRVRAVYQAEPGSLDAPFGDKECKKDSYTVWEFQVLYGNTAHFPKSRPQANTLANSGSKNLAWLANLGVTPSGTDENGLPTYDLDRAVGIPCIIRVAKPRQDKKDPTVWYTGAVVDVFGLEG